MRNQERCDLGEEEGDGYKGLIMSWSELGRLTDTGLGRHGGEPRCGVDWSNRSRSHELFASRRTHRPRHLPMGRGLGWDGVVSFILPCVMAMDDTDDVVMNATGWVVGGGAGWGRAVIHRPGSTQYSLRIVSERRVRSSWKSIFLFDSSSISPSMTCHERLGRSQWHARQGYEVRGEEGLTGFVEREAVRCVDEKSEEQYVRMLLWFAIVMWLTEPRSWCS